MQRKSFIESLVSLGALGCLPVNAVKPYKKFYLLQCFVAGFWYYKGMKLLQQMKEGDQLELVREPANEYDACAIALHWNNEKIGFIPASDNETLSRLLDADGLELTAEITHLNKQVQPWESLYIAVYFLKETSSGVVTDNMQYLTRLETPHYTSFKSETGEDENETDWYSFFEEHSRDDSIYDIIHSSDVLTDYTYGAETGEYLLINRNRLPQNDEVVKQILQGVDETMSRFDNLFDEEGYIVLSTNQAKSFIPKLEKIVNVTDKLGRHFIELVV